MSDSSSSDSEDSYSDSDSYSSSNSGSSRRSGSRSTSRKTRRSIVKKKKKTYARYGGKMRKTGAGRRGRKKLPGRRVQRGKRASRSTTSGSISSSEQSSPDAYSYDNEPPALKMGSLTSTSTTATDQPGDQEDATIQLSLAQIQELVADVDEAIKQQSSGKLGKAKRTSSKGRRSASLLRGSSRAKKGRAKGRSKRKSKTIDAEAWEEEGEGTSASTSAFEAEAEVRRPVSIQSTAPTVKSHTLLRVSPTPVPSVAKFKYPSQTALSPPVTPSFSVSTSPNTDSASSSSSAAAAGSAVVVAGGSTDRTPSVVATPNTATTVAAADTTTTTTTTTASSTVLATSESQNFTEKEKSSSGEPSRPPADGMPTSEPLGKSQSKEGGKSESN
ncbi:hypothetical protein TYRP_021983 [Tyrophagus putrescentiae]|nr:hypothetical protein TYRP_021983 [Tyrophagus putrescentiae]